MGKPTICICENKDVDQLRGNREADQRLCFRYMDSAIPLLPKYERTSLHKGVLVVPEYFNNILVAYSHIMGICTGEKFELNGLLVW